MDKKEIEDKLSNIWEEKPAKQPKEKKEASWNDFSVQVFPAKRRRANKIRYLVAACLVIGLSLTALLTLTDISGNGSSMAYTVIGNPTGIMKRVELPDHSIVELEPDATIEYRDDFSQRRDIIIKGTAFFRVQKDKKHPFRVFCGQTTTTVLGTSFNVKDDTGTVTVQLYEGKVQMSVANNASKWILAPGEEFTYDTNTVNVKAFERFRDFDGEKMSAIIQYINENYGYRVEMPAGYINKEITLRINKKEELSGILTIISQMYNLTPTVNEELKQITFR